MNVSKILVVATTPDYITLIRNVSKGRAVFLTATALRAAAANEPAPKAGEEVLYDDFADSEAVVKVLALHLEQYGQTLAGVTAFDCESLPLAAVIARHYHLPFPDGEAVQNCRDKLLSKQIWRKAGITVPEAVALDTTDAAAIFCSRRTTGCVIKPRVGSGSELTYYCGDVVSAAGNWLQAYAGLLKLRDKQLPAENLLEIIGEQYIDAEEYSADVAINGGSVQIIRLARKIKFAAREFGTTTAYELLNRLPQGTDEGRLEQVILAGLTALGVDNALCMLDLFINGNIVILLETSPRPGGDCLPFVIRYATGQDMLIKALDFAADQSTVFKHWTLAEPHVGVRLLASDSGTLVSTDVSRLQSDENIREVVWYHQPGHRIVLPPENYVSRVLGHVVARLADGFTAHELVKSILERVEIKISIDGDE